jgi:iron-sulfur cluster repair protein YtfE (RIC family)
MSFTYRASLRAPWKRPHLGLRESLTEARQQVWTVVERLERCEGPGRASRRGRKQLESLERFLVEHFAQEEGRGYLDEALKAAPRYNNQAERLRREHGELMSEIRTICELAESAATSPDRWAEVYRAYDAFAEQLQMHDEAENEIMTRAVLEDLGPGD